MQSCADPRAGRGAEAAALLPTSNHRLRDSVLFQQKVCPIAKYQLQKNLSKLELPMTFPITAEKITGISHLRQ